MSLVVLVLVVLGGLALIAAAIFGAWMLGYVIGRNEVLKELGAAEAQRDEALGVLEELAAADPNLVPATSAAGPEPGPNRSRRGFGVSARSRRPGGPQ